MRYKSLYSNELLYIVMTEVSVLLYLTSYHSCILHAVKVFAQMPSLSVQSFYDLEAWFVFRSKARKRYYKRFY